MKTLKFALVLFLITGTAFSFANIDQDKLQQGKYIKISLEKACKDPCFQKAIYQQVSESMLYEKEQQGLYLAEVRYMRGIFLVYGKYREWETFFVRETGQLGPPNWEA